MMLFPYMVLLHVYMILLHICVDTERQLAVLIELFRDYFLNEMHGL